jgi:hypothetical protein
MDGELMGFVEGWGFLGRFIFNVMYVNVGTHIGIMSLSFKCSTG